MVVLSNTPVALTRRTTINDLLTGPFEGPTSWARLELDVRGVPGTIDRASVTSDVAGRAGPSHQARW